jgi:hypothetical protein
MEILKQLFTGRDGKTQDIGRWSWVMCMFAILGHSVWSGTRGTPVDLVQLATALGMVVAAHGAALWAKASTEP